MDVILVGAGGHGKVVLDILPSDAFTSAFVKEDGEAVLDAEGKRIV